MIGIDTTVQPSLLNQGRQLLDYHELLRNFIRRDIKAQVKQSLLGYLWIFLPPLFSMGVFSFLFSGILRVQMTDQAPYSLFLICTLLPWQMFSNMMVQATSSLVSASALIKQIYFPRETIVLSTLVAEGIKTAIASTVLLGFMVYYHVPASWALLWIPVLVFFQLLFTLGLCLPLALFNGFARDISKAMQIVMTFWMYVTPVVYPIEKVPATYQKFFVLNPMATYIQAYKQVLLDQQQPDLGSLSFAAGVSIFVFIAGYYVFKRCESMMADII